MENLHIEETKCTPFINGDVNGALTIKGNCFPENYSSIGWLILVFFVFTRKIGNMH